jgi:hypothetical protein
MGYDGLRKQSLTQLQRLIQARSKVTGNVVLTPHAKEQMARRGIASPSVFKCLREGSVMRQPETNSKFGTLECRIERLCSGSDIGVIVAICDEDPTLVVVTAMFVGRKRTGS